jgi:hypothetical protein
MSVPTQVHVEDVKDEETLRVLHEAGTLAFEEWMRCAADAAMAPPWEWLIRAMQADDAIVLAAWDQDRKPLAYAVIRAEDGLEWFCTCVPWADVLPPDEEERSAFCQIGLACVERCQRSYGVVASEDLRAAMLATSPFCHERGDIIEFRPERREDWPSPATARDASGDGVPS